MWGEMLKARSLEDCRIHSFPDPASNYPPPKKRNSKGCSLDFCSILDKVTWADPPFPSPQWEGLPFFPPRSPREALEAPKGSRARP